MSYGAGASAAQSGAGSAGRLALVGAQPTWPMFGACVGWLIPGFLWRRRKLRRLAAVGWEKHVLPGWRAADFFLQLHTFDPHPLRHTRGPYKLDWPLNSPLPSGLFHCWACAKAKMLSGFKLGLRLCRRRNRFRANGGMQMCFFCVFDYFSKFAVSPLIISAGSVLHLEKILSFSFRPIFLLIPPVFNFSPKNHTKLWPRIYTKI